MKTNVAIDVGVENILKYLDIKPDDKILYLGGRIDDNSLYPPAYNEYLRKELKKLKPTKIIAHSHWYALRYYERQILSDDSKIDMFISNATHTLKGKCQPIDIKNYDSDTRKTLEKMLKKNPEAILVLYKTHSKVRAGKIRSKEPQKSLSLGTLSMYFNSDNIRCISIGRPYKVNDLIDTSLSPLPDKAFIDQWGKELINATDGFAILNGILSTGFKNLSIMGFTAFGRAEDTHYFTPYSLKDRRFHGRNYFEIKTTENQMVESEVLKNYIDQKRINNLEDHDQLALARDILLQSLEDKNS
jgi:hypothetical protein